MCWRLQSHDAEAGNDAELLQEKCPGISVRFFHLRNCFSVRRVNARCLGKTMHKLAQMERSPERGLAIARLTVFIFLGSLVLSGCQKGPPAVSGTIEVDETHVGPRSGGRVEKIFAQE